MVSFSLATTIWLNCRPIRIWSPHLLKRSLRLPAMKEASGIFFACPWRRTKGSELFRSVFQQLIESDRITALVVSDVFTKFDRLSEILSEEMKIKLLRKYDEFKIVDELSGDKWNTIQPSFLVASKQLKTKHYETAVEAIRAGLTALSREQWTEALNTENNALHLLFALIELGEAKPLETAFFDALRAHAQGVIDGAVLPTRFAESWHKLPLLLSVSHRPQFYRSVRDQLVNKMPTSNIIVQTLKLLGTEFTANADLPRKADVIRTIIEPLVAAASDDSLNCLEAHSSAFAQTIKAAPQPDRQFLADRFGTVVSNSSAEQREKIERVAHAIGIDLPPPTQQEETESA
jgi:hypothetical protein